MSTARDLLTFAVGGAAGFIVGRYPHETLEKVRGGVGLTLDFARERIDIMTESLPLRRSGGHRAGSPLPSGMVLDRTTMPYSGRSDL